MHCLEECIAWTSSGTCWNSSRRISWTSSPSSRIMWRSTWKGLDRGSVTWVRGTPCHIKLPVIRRLLAYWPTWDWQLREAVPSHKQLGFAKTAAVRLLGTAVKFRHYVVVNMKEEQDPSREFAVSCRRGCEGCELWEIFIIVSDNLPEVGSVNVNDNNCLRAGSWGIITSILVNICLKWVVTMSLITTAWGQVHEVL